MKIRNYHNLEITLKMSELLTIYVNKQKVTNHQYSYGPIQQAGKPLSIYIQLLYNIVQEQYCFVNIAFIWKAQLDEILSERRSPDHVKVKNCLLKLRIYSEK